MLLKYLNLNIIMHHKKLHISANISVQYFFFEVGVPQVLKIKDKFLASVLKVNF